MANWKPMPSHLALLPHPRALKRRAGKLILPKRKPLDAIQVIRTDAAPNQPEGYALEISSNGVKIKFREAGGLRAAAATLRQLLRQYGRHLPCLEIRDWPDFARRGVMLDISRAACRSWKPCSISRQNLLISKSTSCNFTPSTRSPTKNINPSGKARRIDRRGNPQARRALPRTRH